MIKIGDKYRLIKVRYNEGAIVKVVDSHEGRIVHYTVVDEHENGYLVEEKNLEELLEFPRVVHKEITGISYLNNKIVLSVEGEDLSFSTDKKGNLLINGIPKIGYSVGNEGT